MARIDGTPHTADELERVARLLRMLNETETETNFSLGGEVKFGWVNELMGVVKPSGDSWQYVPIVEVEE